MTLIAPHSPAAGSIVETEAVAQALEMARTVMDARADARIGQIIGAVGTGKTAAGQHIADRLNAVRVCAWEGMGRKAMLARLADGFGLSGQASCDRLTADILALCRDRLILIDEANHLTWKVIERLRIFVDEGGAALVLIGTDLLARTFNDARSQIYLAQMGQRIGAKRVRFTPIKDARELAAYVLHPRFGAVSERTATAFMAITQGSWRAALELADACQRVMAAEAITKIDEKLVKTAGAWMARHSS